MANEEVYDDEFYQEDFSVASEFEVFVSRLSDLFEYEDSTESQYPVLTKNELSLCEWIEDSESIVFNEYDLIVTRYKAQIPPKDEQSTKSSPPQVFNDLISIENDCCLLDVNYLKNDYESINAPKSPSIHPLVVFYGLRDFAVIRSRRKALTDISQIKLLQSAMALAVNESKCQIPVFVQVLYQEQDVYLGIYESGEFRLSFDIVHLRTPPPSCKYLSGLLDMFKGKIGIAYVNPVMVSVCLSYGLKNFLSASYQSDKKSDNDDWDVVDFANVISTFPFGTSADPINELLLYCKWPQVSEAVVFDSSTFSDFNPINAPKWSIRTRFDYTPVCYLADMLHEYLTLTESPEALSEYYNFLSTKHRSGDANPFASLTDSRISALSMTSMLDRSYTIDGPLNEQQLKSIFSYLLPGEDDDDKIFSYNDRKDENYDPQRIKSANPDSLVHRLSIALANIYTSYSGRRGVAQLWTEFSQKIRERVERCSLIPG